MKKRHIILLAVFAAVICCLCLYGFYHVSEFALSSYYTDIKYYEKEHIDDPAIFLGPIEGRRDAVKKADPVLCEIYGEDTIKGERPFKVGYDSLNEVWLIQGRWWHILPRWKGGVANMLIRGSDGEVIAVWHEE